MMNGESASLGGGTVSTVESVESAPGCESEWTAVRCVLQFAAVTDEVLGISASAHRTDQTKSRLTPRRLLSDRARRKQRDLVGRDPKIAQVYRSLGDQTISPHHRRYNKGKDEIHNTSMHAENEPCRHKLSGYSWMPLDFLDPR